MLCFIDSLGYIAEVQYSNTLRITPTALCDSPLQGTQAQLIELSASDSFVGFRACTDAGGLRGLSFTTALGGQLSCGMQGGSCKAFSSRSTYPLRGLQGSCAGPSSRQKQPLRMLPRVVGITAACWTPQQQPRLGKGMALRLLDTHIPTGSCPPVTILSGMICSPGKPPCTSTSPALLTTIQAFTCRAANLLQQRSKQLLPYSYNLGMRVLVLMLQGALLVKAKGEEACLAKPAPLVTSLLGAPHHASRVHQAPPHSLQGKADVVSVFLCNLCA